MNNTLVVVGGTRTAITHIEDSYPGTRVLFHDARTTRKHSRRKLQHFIAKADCVVIIVDACSHRGMWDARALAKKHCVPVHYTRGFGKGCILNVVTKAALL